MSYKYVLDEHGEPVACDDLLSWGRWFQSNERHVGDDRIGDVHVSTVFLGLDHSWGQGPPVLWETMIFGGEHDGYQERYSSRRAAVEGHARAVTLAATPPPVASTPAASPRVEPKG